MDARRALPFLLLLICTINATFTYHNGRGGPNSIRRVRRISEYLVPPSPPPKFHSLGRIPRLANSPSDNKPGYFARIMNSLSWLNPFNRDSSASPLPPPPPLPPQPYSSKIIEPDPLSSATHNVPSPVYKPPPPPSSTNYVDSGYSNFLNKIKNCTPCNKTPWMPMHPPSTQEKDVPYILPPPPEGQLSGEYLTNSPNILPPDAFHSASQEIVRIPDFNQQPVPDGHGNFVAPLPNPQLYPGALPPLFKEENFNSQVKPNENWGHHGPTSSVDSVPTGNDLSPGRVFNGEHNGQYPGPSGAGVVPSEPGYTNPGASNGEHFHSVIHHTAPDDLSSSGTQVSHGHANPTSANQVLESTKDLLNSKNQQTLSPGGPDQSSEIFDIEEIYPDRKPDESPYNPSDIMDNFPDSYGASDYDRVPNSKEHSDLSSSVKDSRAPSWYPHAADNSFEKKPIENPIHFEQSPVIDVSNKGESRTQSSSIPSTSNEFSGFESVKDSKIEASGELSGARQGISSTKSYFTDIYGISTPDNINVNLSESKNGKKNTKLQVIIPYTSDYTPLPFQPSHNKHIANADKSNHDNYLVEESKHEFNIVRPPSSTFQPWLTLPIFEGTTRKSVDIKANNSIDVHKLQKNIDNWTIQKYSKSTIASTVSPSHSSNPYLSRSKTIPKEYFTTTEPVNRIVDFDYDNVKTYTLSGFTFNDHELKGSTDQRLEESRPQGIKIETSTESPIDASTTLEKDMLRGFPLGISSVNKERVYIVTPQPQTTPRSNLENRKQKELKKTESNTKESEETSMQMDMKETEKSDKFESIEKAYQVLPQAVNNLAVASTGPESVPLWGIMEHENFALPSDNEYDSNDTEPPMYTILSTESRAKR